MDSRFEGILQHVGPGLTGFFPVEEAELARGQTRGGTGTACH